MRKATFDKVVSVKQLLGKVVSDKVVLEENVELSR